MAPTPGEPRPMRVFGVPGPGKGPVLFRAMTACDCGCGLKARFEFSVGQNTVMIDDPVVIQALMTEMRAGYELLWPEVTMKTKAELRSSHGTPEEFEKAVWEACNNLVITEKEAEAAIVKYRVEYAAAEEGNIDAKQG